MRARRNSPSPEHVSRFLQRVGDTRNVSRVTKPQAEMPGMETDDAAKVLKGEERRPLAKRNKEASKEDLFDFQLRAHRLPAFVRQFRFAKETHGRNWMLDFANHQYHVAVEIEGLVVMRVAGELVVKGRHASISGFKEDAVKYATAAELGWYVLRFEQSQVKDGTAIEMTQRVLYARGWRREHT